MRNYANAYAEVNTILKYLDKEDLEKIPPEMLDMFEKKKNYEYDYEYNEELPLKEQIMMDETKAILFNIFRDYLATKEQKEKIIKMQKEYREKNEEEKRKQYNVSLFENSGNEIKQDIHPVVQREKLSVFARIKNWIKKIFKA